ncbi:MAG: M15 family metallopeptidase [Ichthyobacteriaceae bacterium]|nr:M15 family metallopeptidase [Ichthyobacteriaceae bacterium]
MKNILKLLFIAIALSVNVNAQQINKYGLKVVSNIETYNAQVKENPNNKLVDLENIIENIALDIVYATPNNFTGEIIYSAPKAYLRKPVAYALLKVEEELNIQGLGLKILDAYRPYRATVKFYNVYEDKTFVASPRTGSIHNRGGAVDLTLINLKTGKELQMPTPFDEFTKRASHLCTDLPKQAIINRNMLKEIMYKHGFLDYVDEWWHYSYFKAKDFDVLDISFDELK